MSSRLQRSTPLEERVDPAAIAALVEALEAKHLETHSLMIVRHGRVIAETWWSPYAENDLHLLYSLTKSFCSTAVGFAVSEGLFSLDDLLIDLFPEALPAEPNPNLEKVKVRHLLAMAVGHDVEPSPDYHGTSDRFAQTFLAHPIPHEPGEHFVYNTAATNMLSILVQTRSGEHLEVFLQSRLLGPLGVETTEWTRGEDFTWGGSGLFANTETIAKLGLLYLNNGQWEGRQLLPAGWSEMATRKHVSNGSDSKNDWNQGYGFQFWRCQHGNYRGDGAFGQFCVVFPQHDAVVAITSGDCPMQEVLDALWEHLLPGFDRPPTSMAPLSTTRFLEPREPSVMGRSSIQIANKKESFALSLLEGIGWLRWRDEIPIHAGEWIDGQFGFNRYPPRKVSAKAIWLKNDELLVKIVDRHRPHRVAFHLKFEGLGATLSIVENGDFWSIEPKSFRAETSAGT